MIGRKPKGIPLAFAAVMVFAAPVFGGEAGDDFDVLLDKLKSADPKAVAAAEAGLAKMAHVEKLVEAMEASEGKVKSRLITILGKIGDARAVDPILDVLEEEEAYRREAITALGRLRNYYAVESLVDLLDEGAGELEREIVCAFALIAHGECTPALDDLWKKKGKKALKPFIALARYRIAGDEKDQEYLSEAFQELDAGEKVLLLRVLGEARETSFVHLPMDCLRGGDRALANQAASALRKITGVDNGPDPSAWRNWFANVLEEKEQRFWDQEKNPEIEGRLLVKCVYGTLVVDDFRLVDRILRALRWRTEGEGILYLRKTFLAKEGTVHEARFEITGGKPIFDEHEWLVRFGANQGLKVLKDGRIPIVEEHVKRLLKQTGEQFGEGALLLSRERYSAYPVLIGNGDRVLCRGPHGIYEVYFHEHRLSPDRPRGHVMGKVTEYSSLEDFHKGQVRDVKPFKAEGFDIPIPLGRGTLQWWFNIPSGGHLIFPEGEEGGLVFAVGKNLKRGDKIEFAENLGEYYKKCGLEAFLDKLIEEK